MRRVSIGAAVFLAALFAAHLALGAQAAPAKNSPGTVININTASAEQFDSLPGIGPKLAARIVEYRQKNGAFKKVEELMNVKGIGEKNFLKLKPFLTVVPAKAAGGSQGQ